ncbi:class E sortase [Candidatus Saccharibacteria bacterium]|nr:class E sortase [Candidatus Saccharibacteria bacterium]
MDSNKGGQSNTPPSWNAWSRAAAANAAKNPKQDEPANKTQQLTSAQKQQMTATELARKKVLEAYRKQGNAPQEYKAATTQSPAPQITADDWRKYHSAWQNYYQKYYGEYYGKAAQDYIAREKMKMERAMVEKARKNGGELDVDEILGDKEIDAPVEIVPKEPEQTSEEVQQTFRDQIRKKAEKRAKKTRKRRKWIPLVLGGFVLIAGVLLQYNQVIAAHIIAYMSPGNNTSNSITALDPTLQIATHDSPYLMIPKLNVEVPVVFGSKTDVASMNVAMGNGVANFSVPGASAKPGEIGNFVISGHSAGNVYQNTNYKFIFSGLPRMADGDLIYMDYEGKRYVYKMIGHTIVYPNEVSVLSKIAKEHPDKPLITLLTCYPLGTSRQRYIIYGEQISPSYDEATTPNPTEEEEPSADTTMPEGDPTPFEQFWKWLTGQL